MKSEWEDDEDDEEEEDRVMAVQGKGACRNVVNVDSFGAAGDGDGDDTQVRTCRSTGHLCVSQRVCGDTSCCIFASRVHKLGRFVVTLHSKTRFFRCVSSRSYVYLHPF